MSSILLVQHSWDSCECIKTFACIIKMHIVMYRDWSGNWDFPFFKTAGNINAAGLEFPLTQGSRGFPGLHL